jgi:hypothetical protein
MNPLLTHRPCSAAFAALAIWVAQPPSFVQAAAAADTEPGGAKALVERHLAAAGGRAVLDQITSFVMTGTGKEREAEIQFTITAAPPGRCLLAGEAGGFRVRTGCDTDEVFWRQDPMGVRELNSSDSARDITEMLFSLNPFSLAHWQELGFTLEADGVQELEGRPVASIRAVRGQGPAVPLYFDAQSGLLVGVGESRLADYRDVGGWKLAHRLNAGKGLEIKIAEAKRNVPLSPTAFARPTEAADGPKFAYETRLSTNPLPAVVRRPSPATFSFPPFRDLPHYNADSMNPFQVDLRSRDISGLDLNGRLFDLLHADFDDGTKWPAVLPSGFEPQRIRELGLNPGLGVRQLHHRGITGRGIAIGIIDQPLLVDHVEYRDRLRLYEEIHVFMGEPNAAMHGAAVASIALGKTVGVAPGADLYFIAETHGEVKNGQFDWDFKPLAQAIERLLDVNRQLPSASRIRVISISVGWSRGQKGFDEANAAVERATREGVFVISTAIEQTHKLAFHGLGREPLKDPDDFASYGLGSWWARSFLDGQRRFPPGTRLLVPMDSRSTASPTGAKDYVHYAGGGWSWSVPYLAGLYALGCQVREDLTPQVFWETALKTGRTVNITNRNETLELGTIADPAALIDALKKP